MNDTDYRRRAIRQRDGGVCAACGIDSEAASRLAERIQQHLRESGGCLWSGRAWEQRRAALATIGDPPRWSNRSAMARYNAKRSKLCRCIACLADERFGGGWEADHVVPVVEGGGLCGLENYRTLCFRCHKSETAALAARRAEQRRAMRCEKSKSG